MKSTILWKVIRDDFKERYIIADPAGHTLDNAQGYGFRDYGKAYNYARNKFKCEAFVVEKPKSNALF